jgi:hypothetical protein
LPNPNNKKKEGKMFEIEKGIPIPKAKGRAKGQLRLAVEQMVVGDSIIVPKKNIEHMRALRYRCGIQIKSRRIDDETYRVWRTA